MTQPPRRASRHQRPQQLSARTLQIFGCLLIAASAIFWAFTNRQSALLLGAGVSLATLGWLQRTFGTLQSQLPEYDPPSAPEEDYDIEAWDQSRRPPHEKERRR